jgi:hypothetical protein
MATTIESVASPSKGENPATRSGWVKFGLIAMASAVLGGVATAWWYRKTLICLRQAENAAPDPKFGISEDDSDDF